MANPEGLEPVGTELLFESDRVRVWEMPLAPGETCTPHRHKHDYLMLYPDAADIRSAARGRVEHAEPGLVAFAAVGREGLPPHEITNVGTEPSTHYVVELLGASCSDAPQLPAHNGRIRIQS